MDRNLPAVIRAQVATAHLPVNYEEAKRALRECEQVDECKEWADRAAALASYARQKNDKTLQYVARRIQVRAQVRLGELLLEIPRGQAMPRKKGDTGRIYRCEMDPNSRRQVGKRAGLTVSEVTGYSRAARVPEEIREQLIEKNPPATVFGLQAHAPLIETKDRNHPFKAGVLYNEMMKSPLSLGGLMRWTRRYPPAVSARQMTVDEAERMRPVITEIQEWCDEFERHLPKKAENAPSGP